MNIAQIENNLRKLIKSFAKETFIYDLLLAYGLPKASITRLKKGNLNLSKVEGEISWKKKLFFKEEFKEDLHLTISKLQGELLHNQRFLVVTDYETILAIDTKTNDKLDIGLKELPKYYDFFLPWAGMEKAQHANENPADIKAAVKMAKLFDEIKKDNPDDSPEFIHGLNVFLSRLLFCFFAEDTHIFEGNQFTNAIDSHTQTDGGDLDTYLDTLFDVLNTPENARKGLPEYLKAFPYVNGGLFSKRLKAPHFTRGSRQAILNSGDQDWSAINPDIFGSMFQAVIAVDQRGSLGQHYTSVPNIMKVIEPLFLNDLYEEFEKAGNSEKKLIKLLDRLHYLRIFDPACGSGNFLIVAYKELYKLEIKILKRLRKENKQTYIVETNSIHLSQFYGIEIDDFAHEIAKLSLWLAEHQMNLAFKEVFGETRPTLPLKEAGQIVQGNATRLDWESVCPKRKEDEIYILGNPPYLGASMQSINQKNDMLSVFQHVKGFKNLDYISCWFHKGSKYISNHNSKFSFVSTNSICQGEQVSILWPNILKQGLEIYFTYPSFKWKNNAKSNAAVTVSVIGVRNSSKSLKFIYSKDMMRVVANISPYLFCGGNNIVLKRTKPLSSLHEMEYGSKTVDGGNLTLNNEEKDQLMNKNKDFQRFIKKFTGSNEFINGISRFCLWITLDNVNKAMMVNEIKNRVDAVRTMREKSKKKATNERAKYPYEFGEIRYRNSNSIIVIPRVSSERRPYIPFGFLHDDYVVSDSAQAIYDAEPWLFGILISKLHMAWIRAVCGSLETRIRYSSALGYNTFPFPPIAKQRKQEITQSVFRVLEEREKHPEKTLAQLYDPDKMPEGLREAHHQNDLAIERCYRSKPFESDEERLEYLFKLYEKMIQEEENNG